MLDYGTLRRERRKLLALAGLTPEEFKALLPPFTGAYSRKYAGHKTLAGRKRQRQVGGGRRGLLPTPEQKLLFTLVYLKAYPLQVVMGELFGINQSAANHWIHRLLPVLRDALAAIGVMPERGGRRFARPERGRADSADYIIDGTERRRQGPESPGKQAPHYSGKKRVHGDKNLAIVSTRSRRVGHLGPTHAGKTHDKKVADCERIVYPRRAVLHKGTGFRGYEPKAAQTRQVKKSRKAAS